MQIPQCPALNTQNAVTSVVNTHDHSVATVDAHPLTKHPATPAQLWKHNESSYILMLAGNDPYAYCGYAVTGLNQRGSVTPYVRRDEVTLPGGEPFFGTATSLVMRGEPLESPINFVVGRDGVVLTPKMASGELYVIGTGDNALVYYDAFNKACDMTEDTLRRLRQTPAEPEVQQRLEAQHDGDVDAELQSFFDWWSEENAGQAALFQELVRFQTSTPHGIEFAIAANYDARTDHINVYQDFIEDLRRGAYEVVRSVLIHEEQHRRNVMHGRVLPSEELFNRSMQQVLSLHVFEGSLTHAEADAMLPRLGRKLLSEMSEEELVAYAVQWAEQCTRGHSKSQRQFSAQRYADVMLETESRPYALAALGLEYAYGALVNTNDSTDLLKYFAAAVLEARNCRIAPERGSCAGGTIGMQELFKVCPY